jgi:multicomponent Na+:H+ antiporter subunit G
MEMWIGFLLLCGVALMLIAAVGLVRLPDVYCRSHAVSKGMTLGISLMLLALWFHLGPEQAGFKVIVAIVFQMATIPVASHLLTMIAHRKVVPRWKRGLPASTAEP